MSLDPKSQPIDHLTLCGAPEHLALQTRSRALCYDALERAVGVLAFSLKRQELRTGDRVASWLPKSEMACLLPLAAARAGLVHVPINPVLRRAQVAHILADSGAVHLITGSGRDASLEHGDVPADCRVSLEDEFPLADDALPPSRAAADELCAILYTSGSTGRPKGVMLSHANLWLGAMSVAHYLNLAPADRVLAVLPLSFDYGQNQLLSTWAAGACVVPLDYLRGADVGRAVEREAITTLAGVPPLWTQLMESDWSDEARSMLKRVTNSGGTLTRRLIDQLTERFPSADIYPMYGLTEAFRSTYLAPHLVARHPDSIGTAIPFAEIMVIRDDGTPAAAGEVGELVHAGPLVAQGYWRDAARTAERFRAAPASSRYGGTAVWSGDKVIADENGLLRFVGRDDEMIKTSGNRVSPAEVEEAALASGVVAEAVAVGRADARLGAAIVLVARSMGDGVEADAHLRRYLKAELPLFMQPAEIQWREALPRNPNGKLDRSAIKREVAA